MKQLNFTFEGVNYTLEYTRKSVEQMERNGFVAADVKEKPMLTLPALFSGAFFAHHRFVKQDVIDRIFAAMPNKAELIGKLAEMYNEPIAALLEEPEVEEDGKNLTWTANW